MLLSGKRDVSWPSYRMSEMVIGRLRKFRHKYPYQHLWYEDAGHTFEDGYLPSAQFSKTLGGTPGGNARAQADSWPKVLRFLKENLAHR
ncbi:MAG: hypothetical protein LC754_08815 [Acidobacteria bacterium]|nr:hypothetical protein [Acidobacteriota bacterium]